MTIIEKIIASRSGSETVRPGDIVWLDVDYRSARDFGGPNVVEHLRRSFPERPLSDPARTYFTFDTNAPANTTGYADNQHRCRLFAREFGAHLYDVDAGIGTHVAMEKALVKPGDVAVGTDSHFNILAAVGAFGQGMGDLDVAFIFRTGRTWFEVPATVRVNLVGSLPHGVTAKDLALFLLRELGTDKALGRAVEMDGAAVEELDLAGRITLCSLATEAGAIAFFLPPSVVVDEFYSRGSGSPSSRGLGILPENSPTSGCEPDLGQDAQATQPSADPDATYEASYTYDVSALTPVVSPPPNPNGARPVDEFNGVKVDSVFVGSCTNGRWEDFRAVSEVLKGRRVKDGVMLRMVPTTREVYERIIADGTLAELARAGAIVTHPGCGGCASGQIGMTGKGEVQVSTSNRNFRGKQGLGDTYLASPQTAAWTALRGVICNEEK